MIRCCTFQLNIHLSIEHCQALIYTVLHLAFQLLTAIYSWTILLFNCSQPVIDICLRPSIAETLCVGGGEYSGPSGSGASGYGPLDAPSDAPSPLPGAAAAGAPEWSDPAAASNAASYAWQASDPGASYVPYSANPTQGNDGAKIRISYNS